MQRVWELDILRGLALILMIVFHFLFDLREFYQYPIAYDQGIYYYIGKVSVILFILIAGVSSSFSHNNLYRGLKLLVIAGIITIATYWYDPNFYVKFGILHFLGICVLLDAFFRRLNPYVLGIIGTLFLVLGQYLGSLIVSHNYLFWLNLTSNTWTSADYYPLLPWLGFYLYGVALSKLLYPQKRSLFSFTPPKNLLSFVGKHTLSIYLIHQPLLILAIALWQKI